MFNQILCPIDFSEASRHAIQYAIALARLHRSALTGLYVAPPAYVSDALPPTERDSDAAEQRRLSAEAAGLFERAKQDGLKVDILIECGQPAQHILTRAGSLPADVIVIGTHGASGFEHLMLGSVAEKVLRKATCPVFTVPPTRDLPPARRFGPSFAPSIFLNGPSRPSTRHARWQRNAAAW